MPPIDVKRLALTDVTLALPERFLRVAPVAADLPIFTEAAVAAFGRGETSQSQDNRKWRTLPAWLHDVAGDLTKATVVCRRSVLTITVDARVPPDLPADVQLLPLSEEPKAHLEWTTPAGEVQQHPLAAMLDVNRRKLTLMLKFADDQAGRELYGKTVETLSAANLKPAAVVSAVHTFVQTVPASQPGPVIDRGGVGPVIRDHRTGIDPSRARVTRRFGPDAVARTPAADLRHVAAHEAFVLQPGAAAVAQPVAARVAQPMIMDVARLPVNHTATLIAKAHVRDRLIYRLPQLPATQQNKSLAVSARLPLQRRREDVAAFPDLPRQARNGWDQVPNRASNLPPLLFRDSDEVASFFYLPTRFKLGYGVDNEGAGRPPMRAEAFRDDQGNPKVKVTLVALPFIEDADRDLIRTYLRDTVLAGQVPFVRLSPAAGVEAHFNPDFASGPATEGVMLPATIRFETLELAPEKWLIVQFTMAASDYPIFGAMMRKGLRGRVVLNTEGVNQSVPVSLELEDVMTDGLRLQVDPTKPNDLTIENLLNLPAQLSSLRASLLDMGPFGMIFEVEEHAIAPPAQGLAARGTWATRIEANRISGWDNTVVALGPVSVQGGTADDWLNAVNRDPSLQPQPFRVSVAVTIPSASADRVELVQLRLFKQGDPAPRQELRILPASPPVDLLVNMTLEELMGREGQPTTFFVEYETLHKDGSFSMPQRMAVNLSDRSLILVALAEAPGCVYMVVHRDASGEQRPEQDRAASATLVARLRSEGKLWQIYARRPDVTPDPVTPDPVTPDPVTTPTGNAVSIVTNLLGPAFAGGSLQNVFVVLRADVEGAPSTTLLFDRDHQEPQSWRPATGPIPPFRYQVTYVYSGDRIRRVEGSETGLLLLLDPPPAP